jgi:hypothetical protein
MIDDDVGVKESVEAQYVPAKIK